MARGPSGCSVAAAVAVGLGRPLTKEEVELVRHLTPQGIAKLNGDRSAGMSLEQSLAELRLVREAAQERRSALQAMLSGAAREIVAQMGRPPTADELVLLVNARPSAIEFALQEGRAQKRPVEMVIEELAVEFKQELFLAEADALSRLHSGLEIHLRRLSPTAMPELFDRMSLSVAAVRNGFLGVGFNPVAVWFRCPEEGLEPAPCSNPLHPRIRCRSFPGDPLSPPSGLRRPESRGRRARSQLTLPGDSDPMPRLQAQPQPHQPKRCRAGGKAVLPRLGLIPARPTRSLPQRLFGSFLRAIRGPAEAPSC
eukprot:RCo006917